MTISVGELFDQCGLRSAGVVQWGNQVGLDVPGIYIVASTPDLDDPAGQVDNYRPNFEAFDALRSVSPRVTVDGFPATSEKLAERIGAFWIPETAICYVGLACQAGSGSTSTTALLLVTAPLMPVDGG